jgi:type I restriction enzyme, S subunit
MNGLGPYPTYRAAEEPWLGQVPRAWGLERTKILLRERSEKGHPDEPLLAATQTKGVVRKEDYENRTVVAIKDLQLLKLVREGDFVISLRSFQGGIELARAQGIISPAYTILFPRDARQRRYLAWVFKSQPYVSNLSLYVTGIRQGQNVDYERLSRSRLPVPPLDEQGAIVRFLDHPDRRIRRYVAAKRKLIELLNEQKQVIIDRAVTRGIDPGGRLRPSGVEWLGEVPEHWGVLPLYAASSSIQTGPFGSQLHASEYVLGGIPVINPSHLRDGLIHPDARTSVSPQRAIDLASHQLKFGDVVMARRGELGRCAQVTKEQEGWLCGTGSLRVRPRLDAFEPSYLVELLGSSGVRQALIISSVGATMDNLNASIAGRLRLPVPPLRDQRVIMKRISAVSGAIRSAVGRVESELNLMREYRTRLIADTVTGKIDVREAAAQLSGHVEEVEPLDDTDMLPESEADVDAALEDGVA